MFGKKGNNVLGKEVNADMAEEFSFTGTWFFHPILYHTSPNLEENGLITTMNTSC